MDRKTVIESLKQLRAGENSKKNFKQKIDLVIPLRNINLKKPSDQIDDYVILPQPTGKKLKFCALVGKELIGKARETCDTAILNEEFSQWEKKPREMRKLVRKYDYFIAQANIMPQIAKTFGKYLGTKGKMPNPKLGLIVQPAAQELKTIQEKISKMAMIAVKKQPNIHMLVGSEEMDNEGITENILAAYEKVKHLLPKGKHQIKAVYLKLTMSKPIRLE